MGTQTEAAKKAKRRYYLRHKEESDARSADWAKNHPESSRKRGKRYNRLHPERRADSKLRLRYGISLEAYEVLLESQDGKCAICRTTEPGLPGRDTRFCVDHDHITGRVRGLLCKKCNLAVAYMRDRVEVAEALVGYLERFT